MRAGVSLALLLLAGCATSEPPIATGPHLRWAVAAEAAPPGSPRLGVGEIRDARPERMRAGDEPPLQVKFLSLVREGPVRTGDGAFDRPLADAVREDVVATLARSNAFASVAEVGFDPREPGAWPEEGAPDYVLVGELEDLSGSQWRSFLLTPFKIGFLRDRWDEPEGQFVARFELWTRGGLAWRGRVHEDVRDPEGDSASAALDALARGSEALAGQLAAALRTPARPARSVPVIVLDGCNLGSPAAERAVARASAIFEREADVSFVAERRDWRAPGTAEDLEDLLAGARAQAPPPGGVVIAFVPLGRVTGIAEGVERTGLAEPLGRHAVALCEDGGPSALTVAHELAHLFGAVHVRERASVMSPTADFEASFFDPLNRRILREMRGRDFDAPLDARESARLQAIYRAAGVAPDER